MIQYQETELKTFELSGKKIKTGPPVEKNTSQLDEGLETI
jgi:hypothetical protein